MSLAFKKLKVYVRATLILVVVLAIVVVLLKNRGNAVSFWFFGFVDETRQTNVIWLILWTAIGTLVARWVFSFGWQLLRDMREVKQHRVAEQAIKTQAQRNRELDERERRIDEKLKAAIGKDDDAGED